MRGPSVAPDPGLYLDANATEPLRAAAREAMIAALDLPGNPASVHADGRAARKVLEAARIAIAARFNARAQEVVFCGSATEADAMAIHGLGWGGKILIGATEHDAVRAAAPAAGIIPVDHDGLIDLAGFRTQLATAQPSLVCVMAANNETGVIQNIAAIAALCRAHGAMLHVDAVQAAGRIPAGYLDVGASSVAISAHKLGGPKGVGALLLSPEAAGRFVPLVPGGGQELGRRGGTHNLPAVAGFAAAVTEARPDERIAGLRDTLEAGAREAGAVVIGAGAPRLPNTACLALPGVAAGMQVINLDLDGVRVSAGSACSSGKVARSHVIEAMGLTNLAGCAIRVSLPWNAPSDAPQRFLAAYRRLADRALHKRPHFSTSTHEMVPGVRMPGATQRV